MKASRRKKIIKIKSRGKYRTEKQLRKINKTKRWFLGKKINKTDKPLSRMTKNNKKTQTIQIRCEATHGGSGL